MYPTSIEQQKLYLSLKIFHKDNVVTLQELGPKQDSLNGWENTAKFIHLIVKWWKIVNAKAFFLDNRYRDTDLSVISDDSQEQLYFLFKMHS